jgi:Ca2+/H+ antiporter
VKRLAGFAGRAAEELWGGVAIVLLLTYGAGLFFSLRTYKDLFKPEHAADDHVASRGRPAAA